MVELYRTGFEGAFKYHEEISELEVPADGWVPLWIAGNKPGVNHRPEFKPEDVRVRSGKKAAKFFTTHASHDAALAKKIALPPGEGRVTVSAYGATFRLGAGQALRIGIDPTGGLDLGSLTVRWSEWWGQYNPDWAGEQYHAFAVQAERESNQVSIFLYSRSQYAAQTVAAYWDDVLVLLEDAGPQPPADGVDYERIREIVREELAAREPVQWPRPS